MPLQAQEDDEIIRLREKIVELEKRIRDLEGLLYRYTAQDKLENDVVFGWENKKNWRMLKPGMTLEEVKALLGEPTKKIEGVKTLWYYPNIYCGYVSFDENGRLSGWNEP